MFSENQLTSGCYGLGTVCTFFGKGPPKSRQLHQAAEPGVNVLMKVLLPPILGFALCFIVLYWLIWFLMAAIINTFPGGVSSIAPLAPILIYVPTLILSGFVASRISKSSAKAIKLYFPAALGFILMVAASYFSVTDAQSMIIYLLFGIVGITFSSIGAGINIWQQKAH